MARRSASSLWTRSLQRSLRKLTHSTLKASTKAMSQALKPASKRAAKKTKSRPKAALAPSARAIGAATQPAAKRASPAKPRSGAAPATAAVAPDLVGVSLGLAGARRYRLYKPPAIARGEKLPLLVMLHGCSQDAQAFALSTRMNRLAARERCLVLYPEQDRLSNPHACWNWYDTRNGRAQREAALIIAAVDQVCLLHPADPARVAVAGLSAGAGMAALLATRYPARFQAVVMHSGIAPGAADSTATALRAMGGLGGLGRTPAALSASPGPGVLPPLLVIQGSADRIVAASNGEAAARRWAEALGATTLATRRLQRGKRYPTVLTDFKRRGVLAATLCLVEGLGHAWSGGAASQPFSDPKGPDASRLLWAFVSRQFERAGRANSADIADIARWAA